MNDAPPHRPQEAGIQSDHTVSPITATLAALFGVVILTLVLYGLNASSERPELASNATPAQEPAGATQQGAGNANNNPPGATKAQPQATTASQAPASQAPTGQPAGDAPNAAAPAKPDG